jgi:Uri superfamily endonuclease
METGVTLEPQRQPGTYALVLLSDAIQTLEIGRLGTLTTEPGVYVYTGSAFGPGGVAARVSRHSRRDKPMHWHVDYLRPEVQLLGVWYTYDLQRLECSWSGVLSSMKTASVPLVGFGSSDCKQGCKAHLYFFPSRPSLATFRRRVRVKHPGHTPIHVVHVSD